MTLSEINNKDEGVNGRGLEVYTRGLIYGKKFIVVSLIYNILYLH